MWKREYILRDRKRRSGIGQSVTESGQVSSSSDFQGRRRAYTIPETGRILRVSRATLYRMFREGRLASIKIGNCRRVTDDAIDAVLNGQAA